MLPGRTSVGAVGSGGALPCARTTIGAQQSTAAKQSERGARRPIGEILRCPSYARRLSLATALRYRPLTAAYWRQSKRADVLSYRVKPAPRRRVRSIWIRSV